MKEKKSETAPLQGAAGRPRSSSTNLLRTSSTGPHRPRRRQGDRSPLRSVLDALLPAPPSSFSGSGRSELPNCRSSTCSGPSFWRSFRTRSASPSLSIVQSPIVHRLSAISATSISARSASTLSRSYGAGPFVDRLALSCCRRASGRMMLAPSPTSKLVVLPELTEPGNGPREAVGRMARAASTPGSGVTEAR